MIKKHSNYPVITALVAILVVFAGCNHSCDLTLTNQLADLDSLVYKYPKYVFYQSGLLNKDGISPYNRAYIGLLQTIASENTGKKFDSDSTINAVVDEFSHRSSENPQNYMRALMFQGIVRYHTGITDSRAYLPLKEALKMSDETEALNTKYRQIAYYYSGVIHNRNNNINSSHEYFKQALLIAEILNDSTVLFKTYRDMFWNRMKALDFPTARTILETLQSYHLDSEEKERDVKNAESLFYNSQKKYRNALELDYELLQNDKRKNDKAALLADYFRISDNYKYQHKLDSALHYGELAVNNIADTTFYLNYYYYLNVAEIASRMNNWKKSSENYAQVYRLMNNAIGEQLNTQILELERKYDLSKAENRAMKLKNGNMWLQFVVVTLLLLFLIAGIIVRNKARIRKETEKSIRQENKILEQEKQIAKEREKQVLLDKKLTERKLVEKQFVIPIYRQISQRNLDIKNFLLDLQSSNYISKNPQMLEKIENEYKNFIQTTKITDAQLLNDEMFADLTGIRPDESNLFNESDKMLLAFIATGADNQQMATLMNASVESIRVRKSKLKKKMQENNIRIPDDLLNDS